MEAILLSMVSGLCVNIITRASGKLGLSKTYVSVGLCIIIGVGLYVAQLLIQKYTVQREQIVAFAGGCYAMSQVVYNLYQKIVVEGAGAEEIQKEITKETKRGRKKKE